MSKHRFEKTSRTHHGHLGNPLPSQMIALDFVLGKAPQKRTDICASNISSALVFHGCLLFSQGDYSQHFPSTMSPKPNFSIFKLQTPPVQGGAMLT